MEKIEIKVLTAQYPQGSEKQLIENCTGRQVPSGGLPSDVGCVVSNVGTYRAIYHAVRLGKPLGRAGNNYYRNTNRRAKEFARSYRNSD